MEDVRERTERWILRAVVGLGLCPFAREPLDAGRVRIAVSEARADEALLYDLDAEVDRLLEDDAIETTLLVHPGCLSGFEEFNDFLGVAELLLRDRGLEGVLQLASFHPGYRFADAPPDDPGNWTNRAPFPTLHLLREASVERAVDGHPDPDAIWRRNISRLARMSRAERDALVLPDGS